MLLKTVEKKTECVNGLITSLKYTSWMVKNRGLGGGGNQTSESILSALALLL